jgi:serine/threonine protein kinase/Tol biopolymer transport system component
MTERWDRIQSIFLGALDLPPQERSAFLNKACAGDDELRGEVESLIAHDSEGEQISDALQDTAQSLLDTVAIKHGTRVGGYEIVKLIGSGGMGEVYQARDMRLARDVAIKVLPTFLTNDPDRLRRFEQEARAAAALNHPNIVAVYQLGFYQDAPYLVSELLEGHTLRELMKHGPLPPRNAIEYAVQIARGLAAAHGKGITHRDLKPENLFATRDGRVKILDFGLAKLSDPTSSGHIAPASEVGIVMGTVGYMSPEQVRGQAVDHRSDFFSFGAILYEMLSGQRAFRKPTSADTMSAILKEDPQELSQFARTTPPALQRVVRRCLEKNPEQRFQSASDLAFALEALSDASISGLAALPTDGGWWDSGTTTAARTRFRKRVFPWAIAACGLLLALGYVFRPVTPLVRVGRTLQLTTSGVAARGEPLYTDGPRVYYQSTGPLGTEWQLRQVLLNGDQDAPAGIPSGKYRIRGLSPDDTEFVATLFDAGGQYTVWKIPVAGGSPRRIGDLTADDIAWSHDGAWFACNHTNQLLLAKSDGTLSRKLATMTDAVEIDHIRWSPDDRRIRFTVLTATTEELWEVRADGGNLHPLHFNWLGNPMERYGEWTPDGRYYIFNSNREGISNLWALEEKTDWWRRPRRDPVQLTAGPVSYYQPVPSRNSKSVLAIGAQPSGELVRYDLQRKSFEPFFGSRSLSHLAFSPDGQWLAYVAYPEGTLWRARVDGTEQLQLTFSPFKVGSPRWSADGAHIAFPAAPPGQMLKNYVIPVDGGNPEPFPAEAYSESSPDWIPGRNALTFSRDYGDEHPALYIYDRQAGRSQKVPNSDGLYGAEWSPDGRSMFAIDAATEQLMLVDIASGKRTKIAGPAAWPVWSPDSQYIYFARWGFNWIFRVHVSDGQEEKFLEVPFRLTPWPFTVAPDGSLIMLREHGRFDVYELSLSSD